MIIADPDVIMETMLYGILCANGFRRSGSIVYRPECVGCDACVPVRVPVADFAPRRAQRRAWRRNRDLWVTLDEPVFRMRDFELFKRYLADRHPDGVMEDLREGGYLDFLVADWSDTRFCRFHEGDQLLAVAVIDRLMDGLSAVYTFYDPARTSRSLGVYAILWTIEHARNLGLDWVYLGYSIADSPKMAYKIRYHPHERLRDGRWQRLTRGVPHETIGES